MSHKYKIFDKQVAYFIITKTVEKIDVLPVKNWEFIKITGLQILTFFLNS